MCLTKHALIVLVIGLLPLLSVQAQQVPGGSLDPTGIPKYVTPLYLPPVLYDDDGGVTPLNAEVALRQFDQQMLPAGFPATTLWGYGNPSDPTTFHNPPFTIEVTKGTQSTIKWINQLVDESGGYLSHIILDEIGNPVIDQTLQWAAPNQECLDSIPRTDCRGRSGAPYLGPIPMVTKVQGALTSDTSAGYPESWWLPAANDIPADYATAGTFFQSDNGSDTVNALGQGYAIMTYGNDQPTAALWYRDNSGGITRQNVYASGVGYWIIRDADDSETGLLVGKLPEPAVKAGQGPNGDPAVRAAIREIPLIIQPRSFNEDGSLFYPADRAFFEGLGVGQLFADNTGLNIPFVPQPTSDIAPIWNPEAFFNTMVVNGNTWPFLEVAAERYRIRLLNAADSRYLNLSLSQVSEKKGQANKAGFVVKRELPFYQIGSDLSLLPQVVRIETGFATPLPGDGSDVVLKYPDCLLPNGKLRKNCVPMVPGTFAEQGLLVGPGERADIVVDFTGLADGDMVVMFNTAPDAPFGGFPDVPADPCTTGQVMMFVVNKSLANPTGDPSTPPSQLVLDSNPGGIPKYDDSTNTRDLALLEEESALICVTIDAVTGIIDLDPGSVPPTCDPVLGSVPFAPQKTVLGRNGIGGGEVQLWDDPIAQESAIGAIETWEFWNWSADANVIHLDSVMFEVIDREIIGGTGRAVEPWEQGWKDTVISFPGEVTRVKAKFTIPGFYSWHSNIWSHKDNEMGVPYCVGERGVDCPWNLF